MLAGFATGAQAQTVGTVQFTSDTLTYPEASGSGSTPVLQTGVTIWEITGSVAGTPSITLRATDGTAIRGTDYNLKRGTRPFDDEVVYSLNFSTPSTSGVWTYPNDDDEPDKKFTWTLFKTGPDPRFNLGSRTTTTVIIRDNDPTVVSLARVGTGSVTEGDTVEFTVTLGRALVAGEVIDVPLSVSGTNVTTGDWSLAEKSGSGLNTGVTLSGETTETPNVRFSGAGAQTATLELTAETDGASEGNETFTIALGPDGSGTNGFDRTSLGTNVGGGANPHATTNSFDVVVADAMTGSLTFSPASVTVVEGESTTYTVRLGTEPTGNVAVATSTTNLGDHLRADPLVLRFTTGNWNEPQTVTLTATDDPGGDDDKTAVIYFASGGGYDPVTGTIDVTVKDDDVASLVLSTTSVKLVEGGSTSYTVRLGMAPSGTVTLTPTKTGDGDVTISPSGDLTFTTGNWNIAQTVTVRADHDGDRTNDKATVSYAASGGGYNGLSETVTITVNDDDVVAPCSNCVWVTGGSDITEGGEAEFMLRASPAPRSNLRVSVRVHDAPGQSRAAFLQRAHEGVRTVTIPSGQTAVAFTVQTHDDTKDEPNSYVSAQARGPEDRGTGYSPQRDSLGQYGLATARVNVADNDAAPPPDIYPASKTVTFTLSTTSIQEDAADPWVDIEVSLSEAHSPPVEGRIGPQLLFNVCFHGTARRSRSTSETGENGFDYRVWSYGTDGTDGEILHAACPSGEFLRGETQERMRIEVLDDSHEDSGERIGVGIQRFDLPKWRELGVRLQAPLQTLVIHNDEGATDALPADHPVVKHAPVVKRFVDRLTARSQHGDGAAGGWNKRFLKAMGHPDYVDYSQPAVTVADATRIWNHGGPGANTGWDGTVDAVTYAEQYFAGTTTPPPAPDPEITITAGSGVTEGAGATFTVSADRAPDANLAVTLNVAEAQGSDFVAASDEGTKTVTVLAGETTATLTVATDNDGVDEPDGSVTTTVQAGTGYTVGTASSGTVAIADDDLPTPAITIAAGAGVTEGGDATFTLTATPPPAAALEVTVTVAASGDYGIAAGERTVTLPTTGAYTLTLATVGDDRDEPNGSVSVTVDAGTGYTVGTASSGTVAIADDDLPPPVVSVTAGAGVTEGGDALFTVTADRAPDANLAVALTVAEAAGSDFVAAADEGARTVTIEAGKTAATLTVRTDDDTVDEPNGSVTATVAAGDGYTVGAASSGTVAIADNDAAGRPMVSVDDATAREGQTMQFAVRLSAAAKRDVWVRVLAQESNPVSARAGRDFQGPYYSAMVRIRAGQTVGQFGVRIHDDSHDDGGETFEAKVLFVMNGVAGIADGVAVGTIENADPLPAAYLARFGRTVAEQALDGIAGRMSAQRTPGMQGTVAGQSLSFDPATSGPSAAGATPATMPADREAALAMAGIARGLGAEASAPAGPVGTTDPFGDPFGLPSPHAHSMSAREALLGSSFSLTGETDASGGSLAFWGRASQNRFDGVERGDGTDIRLDGTVTTGMLGADYARGDWLVGLALTQSASEGEYGALGGDPCPGTDASLCDGAVRAGDGEVEASLTAALPYASVQASERLKLWGSAGFGSGEVTLKTMDERYSADTSWTMAAAGLRGDLLEAPMEGSGPALALTSDALWTRTSSEKTRDLAASDSDVTRLRLGLEGSYRMALEGDGHLTPKLELGARHDGGDAETGFGVELGGGLAWSAPALGLSLDVSGRTLLAHEDDDLEDRGISAALAFDPDPATGRGLSLSLRQELGGQASGGLDALFATAPLEDRTGSEAASRWSMEAAYGVPAFGGRFTGSPHVGLGLSTGARDYSLGWRLTPEAASAPALSLGLKATRRESDTVAPEHTVGVEATMRW